MNVCFFASELHYGYLVCRTLR